MSEIDRSIELADILDFSYCPVRYWLRKQGAAVMGKEGASPRRSGEQLLQMITNQSLFVYHKYAAQKELSLKETLALIWKTWLEHWNLVDLAGELAEYSLRRAALLARFETGGKYRKPSGELYQRPTCTRSWARQAESSGLAKIQKAIDAQQFRAGLAQADLGDEIAKHAFLGLADVYALSEEILRKAALPDVAGIVGVNVPMEVELLSCRILVTADLVLDSGEVTLRGRPRRDGETRKSNKRVYELHLYEEEIPQPFALARDLRILALGQAVPLQAKMGTDEIVQVEKVLVRHMRTGLVQEFHPKAGEGLDVLESLAASVAHSIRAGAFIPRMVCGWRACGECDYRPVCFTDPGIMQAVNPPLMAQIETGQALYQKMGELLAASALSVPDALESLLDFWEAHPLSSVQSAQYMLRSMKGD